MLGAWAPSLEELYAADNDVSDVAEVAAVSSASGNKKVDGFRRLKSLDLSETELSSWEQVRACVSCCTLLSVLGLAVPRVFACSSRVCMATPPQTPPTSLFTFAVIAGCVDCRRRLLFFSSCLSKPVSVDGDRCLGIGIAVRSLCAAVLTDRGAATQEHGGWSV